MSVRSTFVSIFVGFAALLGCLVFVAYLSARNQKAVEDSEARRFASYQLADELRQSSDDLTRFARSYVVTGDLVFERHFFDVLAIRSGEKPRPKNYGGIYWDFVLATGEKPAPDGPPASLHSLMRKMRFTDAEFRKLAESEANSNALVQLEEQSMSAIKESSSDQVGVPGSGGDAGAEAARQMMFGKDYHVAKAAIMKPLDEFLTMLDERTALEVAALHRKGRIYGVVALGLTGAGLLFTLGAFVALDRRVQKPVRLLAAAAKRVEAGDYGQPVEHTSPDELGDLAQSFNHMTRAIERDLLEREKHEAALAEAKEAADVANRAKSEFLSNMSHELRTPLNGVLGYVQILQRDRTLGPSQKKSLDSISHCGEHLLSLINDVLDLSKIEAGKLEISEEATDLSQLLDGIRDIIQPKAASKGLQFLFKASPEVPRGIVTDPMKLSQVLINLLGNATKFTPDGTVSLRVSEAVKGELRFDVDDTGMGIGEEKLQEIFEPFKQAEGGETEGGTGLGLAISSRIAEALGGSLTATSELGDGSCFTLTIPLHETDDLKGEDFSVTVPGFDVHFRLPEGETRSVLIADDRETNREILDQILTDAGFETVLADDGDVALERMRERDFDVFLCDVRMPRMNGIEVIKAIRADKELASAKVFAVTASVFPEFRDQALGAGFDEFLMKPLRVAELAQKLGKVLDLEFEGEPDPQPDQACAGAGGDPSELFAELPGDLVGELAEAAKGRNLTRLSAIVSRLLEDEQTSAAGQHLESMVTAFDFDALQQMVDGLEANGQNP